MNSNDDRLGVIKECYDAAVEVELIARQGQNNLYPGVNWSPEFLELEKTRKNLEKK